MEKFKVIAATRSDKELSVALNSKVNIIFTLATNILDIKKQTELAHSAGKRIFAHLDLAEGIGKDEYGIRFLKEQGVDGIISTRTNIIKLAKKEGLFTVQRFFLVDTQSVATTIESVKASRADMIEIMPGVLSKIIGKLKDELKIPIVAGGLIETREEIKEALACGATAVSTGRQELWESSHE